MKVLALDGLSETAQKEAIEINALAEGRQKEKKKSGWVTTYMRAFPKMEAAINVCVRPCMNGNIAFGRWIAEGCPGGYAPRAKRF